MVSFWGCQAMARDEKPKAPNIHLTIIINLDRLVKLLYLHALIVIAGATCCVPRGLAPLASAPPNNKE